MRILVAEDDPLARRVLTSVLEGLGHEVTATTGSSCAAPPRPPTIPRSAARCRSHLNTVRGNPRSTVRVRAASKAS